MAETSPTQSRKGNSLISFSTPRVRLSVALHRRGNDWFVVLPLAYGMAGGNRYFGQISSPDEPSSSTGNNKATHDPPSSNTNLNPRFWLRNGRDFDDGCGNEMLEAEDLLNAEPSVFRDSGLKRTRKVVDARGSRKKATERECTEILVEVLVKEEGLCHRCATCGGWENCYAWSPRHKMVGEDKEGQPVYWCGTCSQAPRWWDVYWWLEPKKLPFGVYFHYHMEHVKALVDEQ
ncbi:hypothetical protein yc1106_04715 [Curvularia clavata]|uniref:Uncharacterized protein n=1 Tax=Curvularia clavata TaxID=95742 RepID=A0A9Q8Z6U2_CURCL|nr:hypothetical protein yc1106_04715 [Curvularia clavata]